MDPGKPSKRLDLQGIRALAIIVVLGFHFFPQFVPNGYLGVDQFFVLSGFLMCMLLTRAQSEPPCTVLGVFYAKRFKRILPLYLLIILLSIIFLYTCFPDTAIETNRESATSALLFVSNRPTTVAEDYFQMLSIAVDMFTHTWSLSVEIQFYTVAPLIFLIGHRLSTKTQLIYYVLVACVSYAFSLVSPPTVAFNSVFARIWQFLVGMFVYLVTSGTKQEHKYELLRDEKEEIEEIETIRGPSWQILPNCLLLSLFAITVCPFPLPADVFRPLVTILTGNLMMCSEKNPVLSNRVLTYIGDVSYSLYLIHWPIYAYWKLTANGNQYELLLALLASIILAILCYETFEKWYLHLSSTSVGALVVVLFLLNVLLINKDHIQDHLLDTHTSLDGVWPNMTMDDATRLNTKWNQNDNNNLFAATCDYEVPKTPLGWCRHRGLSGELKLAIIGNSWTANHGTLFYQECGPRAKTILQGAAYGCEPLYPSKELDRCRANMTDFEEHLRRERPDYAFILTRYISIAEPIAKNATEDRIYRVMRDQTRKLLESVKYKLFILDAIPLIVSKYINQIVPMLKEHKDPVEIDNLLIDREDFHLARERHARLVKEFNGRVVLVDYTPEFYNNSTKTFRYFDEKGFCYHTVINHMSPHGLEHVRHVWTDICRKL